MRTRVSRIAWPVLALAVLLGACGGGDGFEGAVFDAPETSVTYDVALSGLPTEEMTALAE